jgi:hypothetical protein
MFVNIKTCLPTDFWQKMLFEFWKIIDERRLIFDEMNDLMFDGGRVWFFEGGATDFWCWSWILDEGLILDGRLIFDKGADLSSNDGLILDGRAGLVFDRGMIWFLVEGPLLDERDELMFDRGRFDFDRAPVLDGGMIWFLLIEEPSWFLAWRLIWFLKRD